MKSYTTHNTKLFQEKGWTTTDKKPTVVISDNKNLYGFVIEFGKSPKIEIHKIKKNGDFVKQLCEARVKKPPTQKVSK